MWEHLATKPRARLSVSNWTWFRSGCGASACVSTSSGPGWRPFIDLLQRRTHQLGAVAAGQTVGDAKCLDALPVREQRDGAGPVGAPHAAIEAKGIEDASKRVPQVVVRESLVRQRTGTTDLH